MTEIEVTRARNGERSGRKRDGDEWKLDNSRARRENTGVGKRYEIDVKLARKEGRLSNVSGIEKEKGKNGKIKRSEEKETSEGIADDRNVRYWKKKTEKSEER